MLKAPDEVLQLTGRRRNYENRLVKIPTPQYIVFYNGTEDYPECAKLRLSDAFINSRTDNEFEFTATVYNINPGKNRDLLDACRSLKGYSFFVEKVRINSRSLPLEQAVDEAVNECIRKDILRDVLSEERSAVMLEMLTTFDEKEYEEGLREEGREEGRLEGRAEGRAAEREMNIRKIAENYLANGLADSMEEALKKAEALLS